MQNIKIYCLGSEEDLAIGTLLWYISEVKSHAFNLGPVLA